MTRSFDAPSEIKSPTGARLNLHCQTAEAPARGILLINHGIAEHASRYRRFAERLARGGYHVYAHDHRGHGRTTATDAPLGQFAAVGGWRKVLADSLHVRDLAAKESGAGLPVFLFGHSMGGLVALNMAITRPDGFRGLALWNANFNAGLSGRAAQAVLALERALKGSDVPSLILPRLTFEAWGRTVPNRRTLFDWLSHDRGAVQAYIDDPLCGFLPSVSMWRDVFQLVYRGANPANWRHFDRTLPIHLLAGGEDPGTGGGKAVEWLARRMRGAGLRKVELRIETRMRHETLNEVGAEAPIEAFCGWLDGLAGK